MITRVLTASLGALLLGGCTTSLSVSEVDLSRPITKSGPSSLPAGFLYRLPAAVITPTAFIAIRDCPVDDDALKQLTGIKPAAAKPVKEVTFVVGGAINTAQVPDKAVLIDYRELQQFLKTSSIAIERHPNGMLKSVNASIEDQTPQALGALAAAAGSVALLATGAPGAGVLLAAGGLKAPGAVAAPKARVSFAACSPGTVDLVTRRKAAAKQRDGATGLLDAAAAAAAELGGKAGADQKKLDALKADVAKFTAQLDKATSELAEIDSQLTLPLDIVTVAGSSEPGVPLATTSGQVKPSLLRTGITLGSDKLDVFLGTHVIEASGEVAPSKQTAFDQRACRWSEAAGKPVIDESCSGATAVASLLRKVATVDLRERSMTPIADDFTAVPSSAAMVSVRAEENGVPGQEIKANRGIIYVEPARLRIDLVARTVGPSSVLSPTRTLKTADVSVPQLGHYLSLPLRAGFGERVELQATFAEDGSLLTATFANPKSSALAVANALKEITGTAVSTRTAIEDRRLKLVKDTAEALSSVVSIQDSNKKLTPTTDPLADLNGQLAKANVEAAIYEAQLRIQAAQAKLVSP